MLRNKACSEKFHALPRDFLDDGGIVEEPPTSEWHQVIKLARIDGELVLVFAAEHAYEKPVIRKAAAKVFNRAQVRFPHGVAGKA